MQQEHVDGVLNLVEHVSKGMPDEQNDWYEGCHRYEIEEAVEHGVSSVALNQNGVVVAAVLVVRYKRYGEEDSTNEFLIFNTCVSPAYRGNGLQVQCLRKSVQLLQKLKDEEGLDHCDLSLAVNKENVYARNNYLEVGFKPLRDEENCEDNMAIMMLSL